MNFKPTLQWIKTVAMGPDQCATKFVHKADAKFNNWLRKENILTDDVICTVNDENQGFCTGDSGSPLTSIEHNCLVGIVSTSIGCAE